ncbi:hypothetical protein K501DRAFT_284385 [Backusella circina FSU 941]|nr:hypothetical protein K501DRAFT_284385 [Backusella circina FSU 941]
MSEVIQDNKPQYMSNSLWGICLKPGEVYSFKGQGLLQLQQCNLSRQPSTGKTRLEVHAKGNTFTLCTLVPNRMECQPLSQAFIAEDKATFKVKGVNEIHMIGTLTEYDLTDEEEEQFLKQQLINQKDDSDEEEEEEEEEETVTGYPTYPSYLSDLLGPDLPDEDDDEDEDDSFYTDQEISDAYGTISFRDVNDNSLIGGFELRHFNLGPDYPGYEKVDLRAQENSVEDSLLNDSIATGLINALLNSGDKAQMQHGLELQKKLDHFTKHRSGGGGVDKKKKHKKDKKKLKKALKMMKKHKKEL